MNCIRCGYQLGENEQVCKNCGTVVNSGVVSDPNLGVLNQNVLGQQPVVPNVNPIPDNTMMNKGVVNNFSGGNVNNSSTSNNNMKFIILGIAIVGAVLVIVFGISMVLGGGDSLRGNNDSLETASRANYKVNYMGFEFSVPDNMIYEVQSDGTLLIGDEADTWVAMILVGDGSFAQIKANKAQISTLLQQQTQGSLTTTVAEEKKIGGVSYVTLEAQASGEKALFAYTRANSMKVLFITAISASGQFDYTILEKIAPIVSSVKAKETVNSLKPTFKVNPFLQPAQ